MLKIGSKTDYEIVERFGHPWVVAVYEGKEPSFIVGPFPTFYDAQNWSPPLGDGQYPVVFALFPPDQVEP